jgi:hypothetical protein
MAKAGKGKVLISTTVPLSISEIITRRADRLSWSKSEYLLRVIELWFSDGCPPVTPADEKLAVLNGEKLPKKL